MSCLKSMDPDRLLITASLVAIAISEDLDVDDMNVLGSFLSLVGGGLQTKASQLSIQEAQNETNEQIQDLQNQLDKLKKKLW